MTKSFGRASLTMSPLTLFKNSFGDEPWFRAKDVATILTYKSTIQALLVNVDDEETKKFEDVMEHKSKNLLDTPLD